MALTDNKNLGVAHQEKIFYANEAMDTYVTDSLLKVSSTCSFVISGITGFQVSKKKLDLLIPLILLACGVIALGFSRYWDFDNLSWILIILGIAMIVYQYITRQAVLYVHLPSGWCTAIEGDMGLICDTAYALNEAITYQTHSAIYKQESALREIADK